jgi:21S rRNA (GM2251-2'-O)-methyltransferase
VYTDKITDPQNFGAIIRSSLFFGVNSIFSGKKNNCPLNPTVSKASTGALELMDMVLV